MTYQALQLDSATPAEVRKFIEFKLRRHFLEPARELLKQPRHPMIVNAELSVTIGNILLDAISGVSALTLSSPGSERKDTGKKFKKLLFSNFPWEQEPSGALSRHEAVEVLYDSIRNPITHALGISEDDKIVEIKRMLTKRNGRWAGYREQELVQLERSLTRSTKWGPTVRKSDEKVVVMLDALYWGTRVMIANVTKDQQSMRRASAILRARKNW